MGIENSRINGPIEYLLVLQFLYCTFNICSAKKVLELNEISFFCDWHWTPPWHEAQRDQSSFRTRHVEKNLSLNRILAPSNKSTEHLWFGSERQPHASHLSWTSWVCIAELQAKAHILARMKAAFRFKSRALQPLPMPYRLKSHKPLSFCY